MLKTILALASLTIPFLANSQTIQTTFGKNRVQYHKQFEDWLYYETPNFTTYWYGAARNVGQAALQMAEQDFQTVQQFLEYPLTDKVEIIVFSDLTDLKQSNIGSDELLQTKIGQTKVIGNKVFVYFDGNHNHLRAQVREGVAGVILNAMLYGSNLQEIVQNAVLLNLPNWFTEGLTAYAGENWNVELDNQLRDLLNSGKYKNFDKLAKEHPRLAGHAFWNYVGLHFGKGTVSNLLYLTRINRSVDAGFYYVLGGGYRRTTDAMLDYFRKRYREDIRGAKMPDKADQIPVKNKRQLPLSQLKISPDGKRIAYASNDIGRWRVFVQDLDSGKRRLLMKSGSRDALQATDYNYPILAWSPDNQRLAIAYERRDVIKMTILEADRPKKKEHFTFPADYQRLYSMDFVNPFDLVFSAASHGFSDLFLYHTVTKSSERLTQDFWDDLDASVVRLDNKLGVLFASNRLTDTLSPLRLDTILPLQNFDIFYYDLQNRSPELVRVTNTAYANERCPLGIDSAHFTYLSDENGIFNRQVGYLQPYTAFYLKKFFLKEGAEVRAIVPELGGEWPLKDALALWPPVDTLMKYLDTTLIDSFRVGPVIKKRPIVWNQTNLDRNILEQHLSPRTGKLGQVVWRDKKWGFYLQKIEPKQAGGARLTRFRELTLQNLGLPVPESPSPEKIPNVEPPKNEPAPEPKNDPLPGDKNQQTEIRDTAEIIDPGWLFQVPEYLKVPPRSKTEEPRPTQVFGNEEDMQFQTMEVVHLQPGDAKPSAELGSPSVVRFNQSRIVPYRLKFRADYISTTMDNSLLFEGLDSYAGTPQELRIPPLGMLMKGNFKDLMEDYVIEAGFRVPVTFDGAEYYLWFDNKKRRIDRRISLYRKTKVNTVESWKFDNVDRKGPFKTRNTALLGQYELRYPLDHFFSLRGMFTLRQDATRLLSTDLRSLNAPDFNEQRIGFRLSAIYDNTVNIDLNLRSGTRAKVWAETVKRFAFNTDPKWDLTFNKGFMTILALDARHYLRIDRRSILAVRLAGATTFGSERILYFLGGEENELFPRFNNNIPIPQEGNFAYKSLAAQMRGFKQNIRNGNSFALINSELRVPVFKYFSRKPTMGTFWRNFQLVGFLDAGTAWQGKNPYDGDNPLNIVPIANSQPATIYGTVNYFRDPLVVGYGAGVRVMLFGMFVRLDYGWGIETREVQSPLWHLGLGTDF